MASEINICNYCGDEGKIRGVGEPLIKFWGLCKKCRKILDKHKQEEGIQK